MQHQAEPVCAWNKNTFNAKKNFDWTLSCTFGPDSSAMSTVWTASHWSRVLSRTVRGEARSIILAGNWGILEK